MKKKFIVLLFILLSPSIVLSEDKTVTVEQCIEIALQNHPDILVSIEDNKKSIANYRIAHSAKSIIINGEIRTAEYTKANASADTRFSIPGETTNIGLFSGLNLVYNLYDAQKDVIEDEALTNIDISKVSNVQVKSNIILQVKNAYYSYLLAKNTFDIREEIFNKFKTKSNLARRLFEQGSRPILDVSKAEVDLADAQLQYEKAKNNERKMKLALYYAMGLEESENMLINPLEVISIPELNCNITELYKLAEVYNPVLRISKLNKKLSQLKIEEERGLHYPEVNIILGAGYENKKLHGMSSVEENFNSGNWNPAFHATISASLPVYSGGKISALVDSAISDYYKSVYKEKETQIDIKNQIRDNLKSLEEIQKQMGISELVISNAQRHLLLAQKSYENGEGSLLELQDADLSVIQARIGYLESKYNYLITISKLINIVGTGENSICKSRD